MPPYQKFVLPIMRVVLVYSTLPIPTIHNNLHEIELCEWQNRLRQDIINEEPNNWNVFKETPKLLTLMRKMEKNLDQSLIVGIED